MTEGKTRGAALVPKLALDVMACEVARVLQLTDSFIVPVSYTVPRKVREKTDSLLGCRALLPLCQAEGLNCLLLKCSFLCLELWLRLDLDTVTGSA